MPGGKRVVFRETQGNSGSVARVIALCTLLFKELSLYLEDGDV